jgi:hypothetical protein
LADLQTRLLHQPLYLQGRWQDDRLKFDVAGNLIGTSKTLPFTLSGIEVDFLKLDAKGLRLDGQRIGLEFDQSKITRVPLAQPIHIDIAAPPDGNYTPALNNIFFAELSDFIPGFLTCGREAP